MFVSLVSSNVQKLTSSPALTVKEVSIVATSRFPPFHIHNTPTLPLPQPPLLPRMLLLDLPADVFANIISELVETRDPSLADHRLVCRK
jgi:hypothetical protein